MKTLTEKRICELKPGDVVDMPQPHGSVLPAVVICSSLDHPRYPGFHLIGWAYPDGHTLGLRTTFDALAPFMVQGGVWVQTPEQRFEQLARASDFLNLGETA